MACTSEELGFRQGDEIEVFYQMPFPEDHGNERVELVGDRWILSASPSLGANRPRIGWTQRWLPAIVTDVVTGATIAGDKKVEAIKFRWEQLQWYDWATGDHISITKDPNALVSEVSLQSVRARTANAWNVHANMPSTFSGVYRRRSEATVGGCEVSVSFIIFQWLSLIHI